jgi:hypothetical protein
MSKELKAIAFADKHDLNSKVVLNEKGLYEIPADLHEAIHLAEDGTTAEQYKKSVKTDMKIAEAVTWVTGNKAHEHFGANPDAIELGFSYAQGPFTTVSGVFSRDAKDHVVLAVDTRYKGGELKRVFTELGGLFSSINS